jgi:acetate kinase
MTGEILVLNAGSSSLKVAAYAARSDDPAVWHRLNAAVDGIGTPHARGVVKEAGKVLHQQTWAGDGPRDHTAALAFVTERLHQVWPAWVPAAIGHRVVHGGTRYQSPVRIDAGVRAYLESVVPLAPLHQPASLHGIDAAAAAFPGVPQVACFDTAFHHGRPFVADAYALPREFYAAGVRRYGFHGLSYEYVTRRMRELAPDVAAGRLVVCHLGNGASMTAVRDGKCAETTMGFTAADGLPMGTRCGQIDPGVLLFLLEQRGMAAGALSDLVYKKSGLLGLSGVGSDMRDLLASADPRAKEAVDYFVYRVAYFVGALAACLGGLDALVFTAGIGEHAAPVRERVCRNLGWLGLELDAAANAEHRTRISSSASKVSAWVVPTDEELMIARHVAEVLG